MYIDKDDARGATLIESYCEMCVESGRFVESLQIVDYET